MNVNQSCDTAALLCRSVSSGSPASPRTLQRLVLVPCRFEPSALPGPSGGLVTSPARTPASLQDACCPGLAGLVPHHYEAFTFTLPDRKTHRTAKVFLRALPWYEASRVCARHGGNLFVADSIWELVVLNRAVAEAMKVSGAGLLSELWLGARATAVRQGVQATETSRSAAIEWTWYASTAVSTHQEAPASPMVDQAATIRGQADNKVYSRRLLAISASGSAVHQGKPDSEASVPGDANADVVQGFDLNRLPHDINPWLPFAQSTQHAHEQQSCLMQRVWSHMAGSAWVVGADCRQARPFACSGLS